MSELQVDQGHKVLNDLIAVFGKLALSDGNEAETRFKVIDGILEKVLGWQKDDISLEPPSTEDGHTDYADYVLSTATTRIVVEAKRAGAAFTLPNKLTSGKLGGFLSSGPIGDAVKQVRTYCQQRGAQFAVVTNGAVWIVFPAVRTDGIEFTETQARIFRSLEDLHNRFVEFWELLSRQRVIEGNLETELLHQTGDHTVRRVLSLLREPNARVPRNTLFQHLSAAVDKVMTDEGLFDDAKALEFCYVRNTERTGFDRRIRMYLADPKPQLGIAATRVKTSRKTQDYFDKKIVGSVVAQPKFFLILGPVGAGKSTFLAFTRFVSAKEAIEKIRGWLYINFKRATEQDVPRDFIYNEILRRIEEDTEFELGDWHKTIEPAYEEFVRNLARGPLYLLKKSDPKEFERQISAAILDERAKVVPYVDRIIGHVARTRPMFLSIDNVDQIEDEERQSEIFAEAQAFAQKHKINVIISLRDTTFRRYRNSATFNAFEVDAIYIDAPTVLPVLSRRFAYARKMLENKRVELQLESGVRFKVNDVGAFFDIAAHSLLSANGSGELIETLAGGNIRRGLTLAREFLASGHVTADLALQAYLTDRTWKFPLHEVFKGAVLGGRRFYREEDCLLPNMFSAKLGQPSLQLLRFHTCSYIVHMAQTSSFEGVLYEELQATLHQVGISKSDLDLVLNSLIENSVLRNGQGGPLTADSKLFPTRLAGYLIHELMGRFNYAEMCTLDAHVYDEQLWEKQRLLTVKIQSESDAVARLKLRIGRVDNFIAHLEEAEERWVIEAKRRKLGPAWTEAPLKSRIKGMLTSDTARAVQSAEFGTVRKRGYAS